MSFWFLGLTGYMYTFSPKFLNDSRVLYSEKIECLCKPFSKRRQRGKNKRSQNQEFWKMEINSEGIVKKCKKVGFESTTKNCIQNVHKLIKKLVEIQVYIWNLKKENRIEEEEARTVLYES